MAYITNKDEILAVPVLDVLQRHLPDLVKRGTGWETCCPIHGEKTPSFKVTPSKNMWKCFGCGAGGNAVQFLKEYPNTSMTFMEALEEIALIAGIPIEYAKGVDAKGIKEQYAKEKAEKERLVELMHKAHKFYLENYFSFFPVLNRRSNVGDKTETWEYDLLGKTYSKATFEKFGVIYAPGSAALYGHAKKQGWNMDDCIRIGLIKKNENGYYDFFNDRVLFPIFDHRGNIIAFGGKAVKKEVNGKKLPKYINSPQSPLYNKSKKLYGLFQTKRAIRNAEVAYLVEGYTDVMSMYDNEVHNVLASCGTALTQQHTELIKRFTRTSSRDGKVVSLRDGDKAGIKSMANDVDILVSNNIMVEVAFLSNDTAQKHIEIHGHADFIKLIEEKGNENDEALLKAKKLGEGYSFLPIEHDPDSYLRQYNRERFLNQIAHTKQDGILWRVLRDFEKEDLDKTENSVRLAGRLLSFVKQEMRRNYYLKKIVKEMGKGTDKHIKDEIGRNEESRIKTKTYQKNNDQASDLAKYQFYISNNQYWEEGKNGFDKISMSNCVIIPLYHVAARENPTRVVKIVNVKKEYFTVNLPTSDFVSLPNIEAKLAEFGNFMMHTDGRGWKRVLRKLYDEMPTVYQITTLGHHNKGFYTWSNGIGYAGEFYECNPNGIVTFDKMNFLLPGYDFMKDDDNRFDDDSNTDEYINLFILKQGNCISFEKWTGEYLGVFKENGLMGIAYYLASLYRDIIYPKNRFFPHLFCFGPKGSGKSTLCWSLRSMFGYARKPLILGSATKPAFSAQFMQSRNGMVWGDEYHNLLDMDWIKLMMNVYDGGGRELRNIKSAKSTDSTQILNTFLISGQDLPTKEIALYTRCITLHFEYKRTEQGDRRFDELNKKEKTGVFSQITNNLQKYRKHIIKDFDRVFDELKTMLDQKIMKHASVDSRMLRNHLIPLTVVKILSEKETFTTVLKNGKELSFFDALVDFTVGIVLRQHHNISSQDEIGTWWRIFASLLIDSKDPIRHDKDFLVQKKFKITVKKKGGKHRESEELIFQDDRKLLFLRWPGSVYSRYAAQAQKEGLVKFNTDSLMTYFEQSTAFIGEVRAKRFSKGKTNSKALVFDADILYKQRDIDLQLTKHVLTDDPTTCAMCDKDLEDCTCNEDADKIFGAINTNDEWKQ